MRDPSFSEMALNAAFDSINAAQKSLEKGLNHSSDVQASVSSLSKRGNQKSNASLKDIGTIDSQKPYSDTQGVSLDMGNKSPTDDKINADLSESQKPYSDTPQNTLTTRDKLDQENKSLLALQIANDAISNALASQDALSKPSKTANAKRVNPVNTPLLLEKKKILQEKKAITDAKIKQASKITPAEIQSKKSVLDQKKENRNARIKQISSIKSPDLRLKKDMINKKKEKMQEEATPVAREDSIFALQLASEALENAQLAFAAEQSSALAAEIQDKKVESIQDLQNATEALKNAQISVETSSSEKNDHSDTVNSALSEAHKSLENLTKILLENQNNEDQSAIRSEADLLAADLTNAAISNAHNSLNLLSDSISAQQIRLPHDSNQTANIKTLEGKSKVKLQENQGQIQENPEDLLKMKKVKQKAKTKSLEKQKILPLGERKKEIIRQFSRIKSSDSRSKIKNSEVKKTNGETFEYQNDFEPISKPALKKAVKGSESSTAKKPAVIRFKTGQNKKPGTGKINLGGKKKDHSSDITEKKPSAALKDNSELPGNYEAKTTRTLLAQQKKNFQIKIGQLKHRIKLLKYQRNPQLDPSIEAKYFPQLARQPYLKSSSGIIPSRVTDSFELNPPSWKDGIERPKTAPRQRTNTEGSTGNETEKPTNRPHTAPPVNTEDLVIGARVCVLLNGQRCLGSLQYYGNFDKYDHMWCGIELDRPLGTHNGVFKNVRYFECSESHGLFVKEERLIPLRSKISY